MKQDFPAKREGKDREEYHIIDHDPVEATVQKMSRIAGPIALLLGYVLIYAAFRYLF